jgi:4-amino-4-deoxychorismate lyase
MKAMKYCNLNGQLVLSGDAKISVFDESFLFGRGVFETIKHHKGKSLFLNDHLKRLSFSCKKLGIEKVNLDHIQHQVTRTIEINDVEKARIKIIVSKEGDGHNLTILMYALELVPESLLKQGVEVGFSHFQKPSITMPWFKIKSTNFLFNIMIREEAEEKNWYDAIALDHDNNICEGSFSNIFFYKKNSLYTPPLSSNIVPGIIRKRILSSPTYAIFVQNIHRDHIDQFEGAFLCNSIIGVVPISKIGETVYTIPDAIRTLSSTY